jgi:glycopeptide antibiotics resistance protein
LDRKILRKGIWTLFSIYIFFLLGNLLVFRLIKLLFHGFNYYYYQDDGFRGGLINPDTIIQNANIIPFKTIWLFVTHYNSNYFNFYIVFYNILLNIAAFMPLGLFLPLIFRKMRNFPTFLIAAMLGFLMIEFLQLFLHLGQFDIDDVILNTIGGIIGFTLLSIVSKRMKLEFDLV